MKSNAEEQNAVRQYLLGLLPPEQWQPLEERLFTDDSFYEGLLTAEDELIEQYLTSHVPGSERKGFENHFLITPERQEKARFARAMRRYVAAQGTKVVEASAESSGERDRGAEPVRRRGGLLIPAARARPALAFSLAAVLLLVLGLSWMAVRSLRPRGPRQVLTVTLAPGGVTRGGGGGVQEVVIPVGDDTVRFQLKLTADEFQSYRATLLTAEGATVLTREGLRPEPAGGGKAIVVSVAASDLPPGYYLLRLSGMSGSGSEPAGSYCFRVAARDPAITH